MSGLRPRGRAAVVTPDGSEDKTDRDGSRSNRHVTDEHVQSDTLCLERINLLLPGRHFKRFIELACFAKKDARVVALATLVQKQALS